MTSIGAIAGIVAVAGCAAIGLLGLVAGWPLFRDDPLVGLVPVLSSGFLVLFAALSLRGDRTPSPENLGRSEDHAVRPWTAPMVMVALIAYPPLLNVLGFTLDTGLLIVAALLAAGVRNPVIMGVTLAALLGVGAVFERVLGIDLPHGAF